MGIENTLTIYTDGSFKDGTGGAGIVLRRRGRAFLHSRHLPDIGYAFLAEAAAFRWGLALAARYAKPHGWVRMVVDQHRIYEVMQTGLEHPVRECCASSLERLERRGVTLVIDHVSGLQPGDSYPWLSDEYYHNIADSLAYRGRIRARHMRKETHDSPEMAGILADTDWCLDPRRDRVERAAATVAQAAIRIGVPEATVLELVEAGHIARIPGYPPALSQFDVERVAKAFAVMKLQAAAAASAACMAQQHMAAAA